MQNATNENQDLISLIEKYLKDLSGIINLTQNDEAIILIGETGAGKSSVANILSGIGMRSVLENGRIVLQPADDSNPNACHVSSSIGRSVTETFKSIPYANKERVYIIDAPGFANIGGGDDDLINLMNVCAMRHLFANINKLKVLLVVKDDAFTVGRGASIVELLKNFKNASGVSYAGLTRARMLFTGVVQARAEINIRDGLQQLLRNLRESNSRDYSDELDILEELKDSQLGLVKRPEVEGVVIKDDDVNSNLHDLVVKTRSMEPKDANSNLRDRLNGKLQGSAGRKLKEVVDNLYEKFDINWRILMNELKNNIEKIDIKKLPEFKNKLEQLKNKLAEDIDQGSLTEMDLTISNMNNLFAKLTNNSVPVKEITDIINIADFFERFFNKKELKDTIFVKNKVNNKILNSLSEYIDLINTKINEYEQANAAEKAERDRKFDDRVTSIVNAGVTLLQSLIQGYTQIRAAEAPFRHAQKELENSLELNKTLIQGSMKLTKMKLETLRLTNPPGARSLDIIENINTGFRLLGSGEAGATRYPHLLQYQPVPQLTEAHNPQVIDDVPNQSSRLRPA